MACVIRAPSPSDLNEEIELRVDSSIVGKLSEISSTHKLYQMYYNLCGKLPPVNNIGYYEQDSDIDDNSKGIMDTHAVYQGLKRPHIDEDGDETVYIYITKPKYIYKYKPGMVCVVARETFPVGAVFAAYVNLDKEETSGEVFNWELVKCDPNDHRLPENSESRYDQTRWIK